MVGLALVDDVEHVGGVEVLGPVENRREVGRGVVGGAVGFADDERLGLEARVLRVEDHERPLAFRGEAAVRELAVDLARPCRCRSSRPA